MIKRLLVLTALAVSSSLSSPTPIPLAVSFPLPEPFLYRPVSHRNHHVCTWHFGSRRSNWATGECLRHLPDGRQPYYIVSLPIPYLNGNIHLQSNSSLLTENGETFGFTVSSFDADFITGTPSTEGCLTGDTCLTVTGFGTWTGTGVVDYTPTPGQFEFTSQSHGSARMWAVSHRSLRRHRQHLPRMFRASFACSSWDRFGRVRGVRSS